MTERERELPEFVREALAEGAVDGAADLERLPELLSPVAPEGGSLDRLMLAVAEPPLRYAPFYERLGNLWDLPEERVVAVLERARDEREWRRAPLPGLKLLRLVGGPRAASANCYLAQQNSLLSPAGTRIGLLRPWRARERSTIRVRLDAAATWVCSFPTSRTTRP